MLNQLRVDSEVTKPKSGRKKKMIPTISKEEKNEVRDKKKRLIACVLYGNSKKHTKERSTLNSKLMK